MVEALIVLAGIALAECVSHSYLAGVEYQSLRSEGRV